MKVADFSRGRICVEPEVVSCELSGGAALLDLRYGTYYSLNDVAALVWRKLEHSGSTLGELCASVNEIYDVPAPTCRKDIEDLLQTFSEARLIGVEDAQCEPSR